MMIFADSRDPNLVPETPLKNWLYMPRVDTCSQEGQGTSKFLEYLVILGLRLNFCFVWVRLSFLCTKDG